MSCTALGSFNNTPLRKNSLDVRVVRLYDCSVCAITMEAVLVLESLAIVQASDQSTARCSGNALLAHVKVSESGLQLTLIFKHMTLTINGLSV